MWRFGITVAVMSAEQTSQMYFRPPSVPREIVFFLITPILVKNEGRCAFHVVLARLTAKTLKLPISWTFHNEARNWTTIILRKSSFAMIVT